MPSTRQATLEFAVSSQPESASSLSSSTMSNPHSFLDLPSEIRVMIYEVFFSSLKVYFHRSRDCLGRTRPRRFTPFSLFLLNRQIYNEALPIYFQHTLFTFERKGCPGKICDGQDVFESSIPYQKQPHFKEIRKVECSDYDAHTLLFSNPKLREITVAIDWVWWPHFTDCPNNLTKWLLSFPQGLGAIAGSRFLGGSAGRFSVDPERATTLIFRRALEGPSNIATQWERDVQLKQRIIFTSGEDVVFRGIPPERQAICEAEFRRLKYIVADRGVRFEDIPVEDTPAMEPIIQDSESGDDFS